MSKGNDTKQDVARRHRRSCGAWVRQWFAPTRSPDGLRGAPEIVGDSFARLASWIRRLLNPPEPLEKPLATLPDPPTAGAGFLWELLPEARRTLSVALGAIMVMFLGAWILGWFDPFGLDRNSQAYSEHLYARAEAPFYDSVAQGDIAVVLINADTLDARQFAWPPRYEYYAEAVRRIVKQAPRALYVDVLARHARDYDDSLAYAQDEISLLSDEYGAPVIFATETPGQPSLFSDGRGVDVAPMAWQAAGSDYPLRLRPENVVPWRGAPPPADACAHDSVALRLYRHACPGMLPGVDACPTPQGRAPLPGCNAATGLAPLPASTPHMVVQWGMQRPWHRTGGDDWRPACTRNEADPGTLWRLGSALKALYASFISGRDSEAVADARERCPYALTVMEHDVEHLPEDFFANRVVILAVDLPGLEDSVPTPIHGRLPGAYLHAMALDNLMHAGAAYRHRDEWTSRLVGVLAGSVLCLALALVLRSRLRKRPFARWTALVGVALVLGLVTSYMLGHVFHLPAPNWVAGFALLVLAAHRVTRNMQPPAAAPPHGPDTQ